VCGVLANTWAAFCGKQELIESCDLFRLNIHDEEAMSTGVSVDSVTICRQAVKSDSSTAAGGYKPDRWRRSVKRSGSKPIVT
jgi:hypothetical protein